MNPASNDAIIARLKSGKFDTPNQLAAALAAVLAGVDKNQITKRGLHADNIVDSSGGTKLSVNDQSAARQSKSTQPPQTMKLKKQGAISTRLQSRVDIQTRVVPAMVISVDGTEADAVVTVVVVADKPTLTTDTLTNQNIPGDPLAELAGDVADVNGTTYELRLSGLPFSGPDATDSGPRLPAAGQTIMVTLVDQQTKLTTWTERNGVNTPFVANYPQKSGVTPAALLNNLCCKEEGTIDPGGT